jgi:hypothetical protein
MASTTNNRAPVKNKQINFKQSNVKQSKPKTGERKKGKGKKSSRTSTTRPSTPTLDLLNDVALLNINEPLASEAETQQDSANNTGTKCPGLITGHLPVELQLEIWSHLSTSDLENLTKVDDGANKFLHINRKAISKIIINRELQRLFIDLHYFDFTDLSLVEIWHRYNTVFSFHRNLDADIPFYRLLDAIVESNPDLEGYEEEFHEQMGLVLMVSDWCRHHYSHVPFHPDRFSTLHNQGWEPALLAAYGEGDELRPGAYGAVIEKWQTRFALCPKPPFIVESLLAVRARPLQDLRGQRLPLWLPDLWQEYADGYTNPLPYDKNVVILPRHVRNELTKRGLPEVYNGFDVLVGTRTERGKRLLELMKEHGDENELVWAGLVEELRIWWL